MKNKNHDRYFVPGLSRGLAVLAMFSRRQPILSVTDVAAELGVSRASAFRLTYTLEYLGFLQKPRNSKKYQLGPKVLALGFGYLSSQDLIELSRDDLLDFTEELGVSSHLVQLDDMDVVYIARYAANQHIASNVHVGTRFPAYATAPGQIMLAGLSSVELRTALKQVELTSYTRHTPVEFDQLIERIQRGAKQGYLVSWGYFDKSLASVSVPIRNSSGELIAAMNITCPVSQFSRAEFDRNVVPRAREVAALVSQRLGFGSSEIA